MPDTPSIEPTSITAGNTIAWTKDLSDYPATSYTLVYYFRGPSNFDITASANGREHSVSVSSTTSKTYASGTYKWESFAVGVSSRYGVGSGILTVEADPAAQKATFKAESQARQILDALMAMYLQEAGRPERSYQLEAAGRQFEFRDRADLIKEIDYWKAIVKQEDDAAKVARGENTGKNIYVRFT